MSPERPAGPPARVVVDTNVLLSAALSPAGTPARLLDCLLLRSVLVFSEATFAELEARIWKPKFDRYLSIEIRQGLLHDFAAAAEWVRIPPSLRARGWSRDPDDDAFVRAALAADAGWLVSGDADLLCLRQVEGVRILSPAQAWAGCPGSRGSA